MQTLDCVLDEIVPPSADGRMPGAGELGLAGGVVRMVDRAPGAVAELGEALAALEAHAPRPFTALPKAERLALLNDFDSRRPGFVSGLLFPTYALYYREPRVLVALGLEPRPPHPRGYVLEPGDWTLLEAVQRRGKIYREC
jgi:hypothetical protein